MCSPEDFIREWLGVPHVYNGRDKAGIDCYGLVWLYYRDVLGVRLPDWHCADSSRLWVARFMQDRVRESMMELGHPEDHCIMVVRRKFAASHMGIYYKNAILHVVEKNPVIYQPRYITESVYGPIAYGVPNDTLSAT